MEWQAQTPSLNAAEIYSWWAEHIPLDSPVFPEAFSPSELELLATFNAEFESAVGPFGDGHWPKLDALVLDPAWKRVMDHARALVNRLQAAT